MKKFRVYGLFTASKCLGEFEAENEQEAIEKGLGSDSNHASLCYHCSRGLSLDGPSAQEGAAEEVE